MDRKEFIRTCGFACLGTTAMLSMLSACSGSSHFANSTLSDGMLRIMKSEFVKTENNKQVMRKYVISKTEKYLHPICVFRIDDKNYTALLMLCTHNGCELQAQGDYLICPCHGSEFSNRGVVQNPPAEYNLKSFKVSENDESIFIHL
jgi:cytochrome b6-f complex iron-sulfur subunit